MGLSHLLSVVKTINSVSTPLSPTDICTPLASRLSAENFIKTCTRSTSATMCAIFRLNLGNHRILGQEIISPMSKTRIFA